MNLPVKELIEQLRGYSVPELCDGAGLFYNTMDWHIKPMVTEKKIVGRALTVKVPVNEAAIVTNAIEQAQAGDIIVIAAQGNCQSSCWGDHRSYCARFQGLEGVVIDGAFRDLEGCEKIGFPVYARAVTPGTAGKSGAGALQVPVVCGGVTVNPGDLIVGDRNGVCVIPPQDAAGIMERALRKREAQEWTIREMERTGKVLPRVIFKKGAGD